MHMITNMGKIKKIIITHLHFSHFDTCINKNAHERESNNYYKKALNMSRKMLEFLNSLKDAGNL